MVYIRERDIPRHEKHLVPYQERTTHRSSSHRIQSNRSDSVRTNTPTTTKTHTETRP